MAKLSDRQKNNIIAKWHTGEYNKMELAKLYKVSDVMIGRIVGKEKPRNAHIVEASVMLESVKKFEKSSTEVAAIEQAVKQRLNIEFDKDNLKLKIYENQVKAVERIGELLEKNKKTVMLKVAQYGENGKSSEDFEPYEVPLDASDYKNSVDGIDKASLTLGVNERHAPKIDVTQQQVQSNNKAPIIEVIEDKQMANV